MSKLYRRRSQSRNFPKTARVLRSMAQLDSKKKYKSVLPAATCSIHTYADLARELFNHDKNLNLLCIKNTFVHLVMELILCKDMHKEPVFTSTLII